MFYQTKIFWGLLVFFVSQGALAQMVTGTLAVTATVGSVSTCTLESASPMLFPNYLPFSPSPHYATSSIVVTCHAGTAYDIGLNQGQGAGATITHRLMTETAPRTTSVLPYQLFWMSNHTLNCGDTIGQDTQHLLGTSLSQTTTVYGEILARQGVEAGTYVDHVTVMVTF